MATFHTELAASPDRLGAMKALVERLKVRALGVPARFSEAGRNYEDEKNLDATFWEAVADFLLGPGSALELLEVEEPICILSRTFQRNGPIVSNVRRQHGRAIKHGDFVSMLMKDGLSRKKAEEKVEKLVRATAGRVRRMLQFKPLGNHLMWSTYCEDSDSDDPFLPAEEPARLIDSLGLPFERGDLFLLFIYRIPGGIERRTPTVADAYGANFFFPFRPGGRTHPIRDQDRWGRPEVVHLPIAGLSLTDAIRLVDPDTSAGTA